MHALFPTGISCVKNVFTYNNAWYEVQVSKICIQHVSMIFLVNHNHLLGCYVTRAETSGVYFSF